MRSRLPTCSRIRPGCLRVSPPNRRGAEEEALRRVPLPADAPGTAFRYSDVNFILLGAIVERVSGESLDTFTHRRIFAPLGMTKVPAADAIHCN